MAYCRKRDFMFCGLCGTMLSMDSEKYAECPLCGFKRNMKEIAGKVISYTRTAEDIRRELKIEDPFIKSKGVDTDAGVLKRTRTNDETCSECGHTEAEYYTRQMRSADEGHTVFFECCNCGHKWKSQ